MKPTIWIMCYDFFVLVSFSVDSWGVVDHRPVKLYSTLASLFTKYAWLSFLLLFLEDMIQGDAMKNINFAQLMQVNHNLQIVVRYSKLCSEKKDGE